MDKVGQGAEHREKSLGKRTGANGRRVHDERAATGLGASVLAGPAFAAIETHREHWPTDADLSNITTVNSTASGGGGALASDSGGGGVDGGAKHPHRRRPDAMNRRRAYELCAATR